MSEIMETIVQRARVQLAGIVGAPSVAKRITLLIGIEADARLEGLAAAARDVCCWCARRAFPDREAPLVGPNSAGNYCHVVEGDTFPRRLCAASSIWSRVRYEAGAAEVERRSPRGWSAP